MPRFLLLLKLVLTTSSVSAQIACGTPEDQAAISHCHLTSPNAEEAEQCTADIIAGIDVETQAAFDALELMIRGLGPGTTEAYDKRLKIIETGQKNFFDAREKICALEGIKLQQFNACCQTRMTRRFIEDINANINWH